MPNLGDTGHTVNTTIAFTPDVNYPNGQQPIPVAKNPYDGTSMPASYEGGQNATNQYPTPSSIIDKGE